MTGTIRVLIAEDHPLYRSGLRLLLDGQPDTEVVGEVARGDEVLAQVAQLRPDVVVMDLSMPGVDGIEATRQVTAAHPEVAVLILTMLDEPASARDALDAGARGYLVKGASGEQALRAIRTVAGGDVVLGAGAAADAVAVRAGGRPAPRPFSDLTDRELDILRLVARGLTNAAIAEELHLGPKTVRNYVSTILRKLEVRTRIEAVLRAREVSLDADPGPRGGW